VTLPSLDLLRATVVVWEGPARVSLPAGWDYWTIRTGSYTP
jgi:hypothetical protein